MQERGFAEVHSWFYLTSAHNRAAELKAEIVMGKVLLWQFFFAKTLQEKDETANSMENNAKVLKNWRWQISVGAVKWQLK